MYILYISNRFLLYLTTLSSEVIMTQNNFSIDLKRSPGSILNQRGDLGNAVNSLLA